MAYKRMQTVPNMMISYQAMKLLKYVKDPTERLIVWDTVANYFEYAREKGSIMDGFQVPNVSEMAQDAIYEMIDSINEGIAKFWTIVDRNKKIRNASSTNDNDIEEEELTSGRPVVTIGDHSSPQVTNKSNTSKTNEIQANTSIPSIHSSYVKTVMESEYKDTFKDVVCLLRQNGFSLRESDYDGLARFVMFEFLDVEATEICLEVCNKNNIYDMEYFFKVYRNKQKWAKV